MALSRALVPELSTTKAFESNSEHTITCVYICNHSSNTAVLDVHLLSTGDTLGLENIIYKSIRIPAEDTYVMDLEKIALIAGESMWVVNTSSNAPVTVTVSHVEMI